MTPTTMNMLHYIDTLVLASLDMDTLDSMAGGPLMLRPLLQNLDMVMDMAMAMNTAMAMVDMVSMEMARGLLMLSLDMATDTDMELHSVHVSQTDHGFGINPATYTYGYTLDMVMARSLLMLDTLVMPAPMSTRHVLTIMVC